MSTDAAPISVFAPAKINLYLHITGKRDDGFHLLDSLIAFADYGDEISVAHSDQLSLNIIGPFAEGLSNGENNLVIKAAHLLAEFSGIDAKADITLTKNLPIASGIGGGSADAAATLHALAKLWELAPSQVELLSLAEQLGADVPVCALGTPAFVSGIGETLTPAPSLPETWLLLANPNVAISTPEVFTKRHGDFSTPQTFSDTPSSAQSLAEILAERKNDLTAPATAVTPVIDEVLSALGGLPGQLLSRLSGSGATCFALFDTESVAKNAAETLQKAHPTWWVKTSKLRLTS